jgi:hypothetical protein
MKLLTMRKLLFGVTLLLATAQFSQAQIPGAADSLKAQATRMSKGLISGNYTAFLRYLHPKIVELAGGTDNMKQQLSLLSQQMASRGLIFQSVVVDSASNIIKSGETLQATIRQHTTIKMTPGRSVATSTLIGVSSDNGSHWKFVDTHNKTLNEVRQFLPELSTALVIPPTQPPVHFDQ